MLLFSQAFVEVYRQTKQWADWRHGAHFTTGKEPGDFSFRGKTQVFFSEICSEFVYVQEAIGGITVSA